MDTRKKKERRRIYIAAPLFSEAELNYNSDLANCIEQHLSTFLPQRDGLLVADYLRNGFSEQDAYRTVFQKDIEAIEDCDVLLSVLDGRAIDEGVAFELGYGFARGKVCVGIQTDPRRLLPSGNNPMIDGSLAHVFRTLNDFLDWLVTWRAVQDDLPFYCPVSKSSDEHRVKQLNGGHKKSTA